MPKNPQEFADLLGAKIVGEVPDVGGGPFGMARLAHIMHQRLTPSQGERPGRPTDVNWASRPKVPMSEATRKRLAEIAEAMSTPERRVSPMQVAAQLLEEAIDRVALLPPMSMEAASQRTKEEPMDQRTMLDDVEKLLRKIAGDSGGESHYRTIRLRNGKVLGVNVLDRPHGHIRVQVRDVSLADVAGISTAGAPSTPGLIPAVCRKCAKSPATYPAWYSGDKGRGYYGFQWHRPDGLHRADLPLIEDCVRWLLRHFPLPK